MRTVSAAVQAKLDQNLGTEPIILVEVEWVDGTPILYSDQEIEGAENIVVDIGGLDTSKQLIGSNDSLNVNITLDDTSGRLKELDSRIDFHIRPAKIYLLFKGLSVTEKILLVDGKIVTPLEWDSTNKVLRFDILSQLSSVSVGFSMEEGDFPNIPEEALGKAWPLVFGRVCWLPAVKVRAPRRGYLLRGEGIVDFTINTRICQALKLQCPSQFTGCQATMTEPEGGGIGGGKVYAQFETVAPDNECVNRRFGEICKLRDLLQQQLTYEHQTMTIYDGNKFPQSTPVVLKADGATFWGWFTGNLFNITNRRHPKWDEWEHYNCVDVGSPYYGFGGTRYTVKSGCAARAYSLNQGGYSCAFWNDGTAGEKYEWAPTDDSQVAFGSKMSPEQEFETCDEALISTVVPKDGPVDSWALYDAMDAADFAWLPSGTEVYMEGEAEELHIVSLLPGTVDAVAAYRDPGNGKKYLTEVPASYYTVYETDYVGYDVVEIGLEKSLSLYDDGWDDDIYVAFTSSVGPNTCDIIQWLIEKYTDLSIDSTTFTSVKSKLTNYPQNFYITERPDVYDMITELARQARCALYIRNKIVYIVYLSEEPSSVRTITESDILSGTFIESLSETEEIYTDHRLTWEPAGARIEEEDETEFKIILKYNVGKYGTNESSEDYYSYNIYSLVLKSGTFWLIREANSWRRVRFDLPLRHLDLDVGDCITLDFEPFSSSAIKCVIENTQYDPNSNLISVDCWTPVRAGETEEFYWAWPSQKPAVRRWPLPGDTNGGGGYTFNVTPPIGHLLTGGSTDEDQIIITTGDRNPSDLDDTLPSVDCEILDYINFNQVDPVVEAKEIAQSAARSGMETTMGGGGAAGQNKDRDNESECGVVPGGCGTKVVVTWHTSAAQGKGGHSDPSSCKGPCACAGGCPTCYGSTWQVCHTWTSSSGAQSFADYMEVQYGKEIVEYWDCRETAVLYTHKLSGENNAPDGQCPGGEGAEANEAKGKTGNEGGP
jgi:hypothetical protein